MGDRQEAIAERLDIGPSVGPPGGGMGMAERLLGLWPQLAVRNGTTSPRCWLLDQRWIRKPVLEVGAAGSFPALEVQLAQTTSTHSVATRRDPTAGVGPLALPPWVSGAGEDAQVCAALVPPAQVVSGAEPFPTGRAGAAADPTGATAEYWVCSREGEGVGPELGAHRPNEPLEEPRGSVWVPRRYRGAHRRTAVSLNHPAASKDRRASSTLRCP